MKFYSELYPTCWEWGIDVRVCPECKESAKSLSDSPYA